MTNPLDPPTDAELLAAIVAAWSEPILTPPYERGQDRVRKFWPHLGTALDAAAGTAPAGITVAPTAPIDPAPGTGGG